MCHQTVEAARSDELRQITWGSPWDRSTIQLEIGADPGCGGARSARGMLGAYFPVVTRLAMCAMCGTLASALRVDAVARSR